MLLLSVTVFLVFFHSELTLAWDFTEEAINFRTSYFRELIHTIRQPMKSWQPFRETESWFPGNWGLTMTSLATYFLILITFKQIINFNQGMLLQASNHFLIAFSRNERTHPNFVLLAWEIETFCGDCKLAAPLAFFSGTLGLVFAYSSSSPLGLQRMHNHNFLFAFLHTTQFSMITPRIL